MFKHTFVSSQLVSPTVVLLTLRNVSGKEFRFSAGQYAAVHFKKHGRRSAVRCFSLVSPPHITDRVQIACKITGAYTAQLARLKPGDSVYLQGPFGDFTINPQYDRRLVLLAGGIGITPFMSMLRAAAHAQLTIPTTLIYSCRDESDVPFAEQLIQLEQQNPQLQVVFVLSHKPVSNRFDGTTVVTGRIDEPLLSRAIAQSDETTTFFLCGPPRFMDSLSGTLEALGVQPDRVIMEAFGQRPGSSTKVGERTPRLIYATTFASILLGVGALSAGSLFKSAQSKVANFTKTVSSGTASANSTSQAADDAPSTPAAAPSAPASTTTSPSPSSAAQSNQATTPATYQPPVSTVS
ncbi:MAG TPA: FAD-dependent oxidoreductase [Candidatus Saccharimonadales bacterium]|nr:FAD-dependent oxidoreductase [Candidatus Saccharimonadales bacterium]